MYDIFSENVAFISREREFEADKVGVSVSSPRDLAYSLTKVLYFLQCGMRSEVTI